MYKAFLSLQSRIKDSRLFLAVMVPLALLPVLAFGRLAGSDDVVCPDTTLLNLLLFITGPYGHTFEIAIGLGGFYWAFSDKSLWKITVGLALLLHFITAMTMFTFHMFAVFSNIGKYLAHATLSPMVWVASNGLIFLNWRKQLDKKKVLIVLSLVAGVYALAAFLLGSGIVANDSLIAACHSVDDTPEIEPGTVR